jgi:cell division protein FtsB
VIQQPVGPVGPPPGTPGGTQGKSPIVQAIVVGVLVIATGVFVFLFLGEKGGIADTNTEVSSVEQQIKDEKKKLTDARAEVGTLEEEGADLQSTNDELQACSDAAKAAIQAVDADSPTAQDAINDMLDKCDG